MCPRWELPSGAYPRPRSNPFGPMPHVTTMREKFARTIYPGTKRARQLTFAKQQPTKVTAEELAALQDDLGSALYECDEHGKRPQAATRPESTPTDAPQSAQAPAKAPSQSPAKAPAKPPAKAPAKP